MPPEAQVVVRAAQAWLQASWHVQVPFSWLEACVEWLQEEAGGAGRLSQQQINQQALDQWLLTDLRDLDHPVLPEGLAQAQKTELRGTFCVQVDSLLDISQPAYGQLQKFRGTECANDEVSAVTQATQRPWEKKPTRMLLLQVTDGVQSLEAMEYQHIPALSSALRPGVKLQLQGEMVCRFGMLLVGPSNIKVLGGEVEDLVDRNNQGRLLCRTLGLPEEQQQQQQQDEEEEEPPASHQGNQEVDLELDDQDLLASLEAQEEVELARVQPVPDSGYRTLSDTSTQSSRSSSVRSLVSAASSRSEVSSHSNRSSIQSSRGRAVQGRHHVVEEDQEGHLSSDHVIQQQSTDHSMEDDHFPDEDFDDLPLDELDSVILQESTNLTTRCESGQTASGVDRTTKPETQCFTGGASAGTTSRLVLPSTASHQSVRSPMIDESDFMDEDMDYCLEEVEPYGIQTREPDVQQGHNGDGTKISDSGKSPRVVESIIPGKSHTSSSAERDGFSATPQGDSAVPALSLTSPPFTYLCLLEELTSKPQPHPIELRIKAFIVTLLGKLSSSSGLWRVSATITDGTGYLDVELSDQVLTGLLGFSVAERGALKRDPARRPELDAGMRRCQEELVDMCCVMTVAVDPEGTKAVVTQVEPVNERVLQELEQRARDWRK